MLMNEICTKCRLTKKAVEYYVGKKLIWPKILENGYRDFSGEDVERLKKDCHTPKARLACRALLTGRMDIGL